MRYAPRIPKERAIYNNYDLSKNYPDEDMILSLMDNGTKKEDITDEMIWRERYFYDECDWETEKERLKDFFDTQSTYWIAFGSVGRWNGIYPAGTIFESFEDFFYGATRDCTYWKFYDENGHLYLTCSHHDGTCCYEIKAVSDDGYNYYDRWNYGSWDDKRTEEYVYNQIIKRYSKLPRFAEKVYGCKRTEYQPVTKSVLINKLNNQAKSFYC